MSEDETGHRPARLWHFFLDDMIAFAQDALSYTAGLDQSGFESNGLVFDATLRKLELIGEAARNVPEEVRTLAPGIPWRQIIATRNRIVHAYLGIDNDTIWSILRVEPPIPWVAFVGRCSRRPRGPHDRAEGGAPAIGAAP